MVTPVARREAVVHLRQVYEVSQRRACAVIEADRTSVRYRIPEAGRWCDPCSPSRAGCGAPALRLSPPAYPAPDARERG